MHLMVRSGTVCDTSRAVGSRSESLRTEELEDLLRSRAMWGRESVEELGCEGSWLYEWGTRWWVEFMKWEEGGRLGFWLGVWLSCRVRFPASFWRSRSIRGTVKAKLPPAENPDRAIRWGSSRSSSACEARYIRASVPSSTPTLNGYSGARRYSTDTRTDSVMFVTADAHLASSVAVPNVNPPPWKLTTTGYRYPSGVSR